MKKFKGFKAAIAGGLVAIMCATMLVPQPKSQAATTSSSTQRQMEALSRGLVAVNTGSGNFLSWRLLGTESYSTKFNVYRDGVLVASNISNSTNYVDNGGSKSSTYYVCSVSGGKEVTQSDSVKPWGNNYLDVPIKKPSNTTLNGETVTYSASDATVADVDGDGEYEIILKWDPSNAKDNSQSGYTSNVYVDCYELDGTQRWRIDLGKNIRAGAHYTQIIAYDLNGDGKAEVAMKTADGTVDGAGNVIGDASKDYRNSSGYVLSGPEYLTLFEGKSGKELVTIDYYPARGTVSSWGDNYGNRVDRFLAGVAYLDGKTPSLIVCRGYYTRAVIVAYEYKSGKLTQEWVFDTNSSGNSSYAGQGNHNLSIADVDNDGKDEIVYGSAVIDNNGKGLYATGDGHGDALHVGDFDPDHSGLEIFQVHEDKSSSIESIQYRDAKTGKTIWSKKLSKDIGRGLIVNIGPDFYPFVTLASSGNYYDVDGNAVTSSISGLGINFATYWDGDLYRETLDGTTIRKWNWTSKKVQTVLSGSSVHSNNGTKATPSLSGDILGDWREEVIWPTSDDKALRIYTTTDVTDAKLYTLMHDSQYRCAIAWQNVAYNQPPHPSYYIGPEMDTPSQPAIYTVGNYSLATPSGNNSSSTTVATTNKTTAATTNKTTVATTQQTTTQSPVVSGATYMFNPSKGLSNSYFTVSGNLAKDKGSATVNGTTISQCLKVESSTSIKFTTKTDGAKLTLYVKSKKSGGTLKVNGSVKFSDIGTSVVAKTITLGNAGTYEIKKGSNESYIFYIVVEDGSSSSSNTTVATTTQAPTTTQKPTTTQAPTTTQKPTTTQAPTTTQKPTTTQAPTTTQKPTTTQAPVASGATYMFNPSKGLSNSYFTVSGNLAKDKGSVTYNGTTLSTCLKVESSTSIKFTTSTANAKLTLIVKSKKSGGSLKVNGTKTFSSIGTSAQTLTTTLGSAGTYEIKKGSNENYIYYIIVEEGAGSSSSSNTTAATTTNKSTTTSKTTAAQTTTNKTTAAVVSSGDIYVSPSGKSSASGSSSDPMDLVTAISKIQAGKTIWMQSGTYKLSSTILISESNSGKSGAYKKISSINGGTVTLDFSSMSESGSNRGIVLDGSYWYFYDVDIKGAGDNGMLLSGDNNVIELCQFYENHDSGLQLSRYNTSYSKVSQWPSYNTIKNCTSFNNKDEATAENADGFAAKLTCGEGNVFDGCIAYCNSDDGWDLYAKPETGSIGVVTIKNCVAFGNGKLTDGSGSANGDMNGFKLGGSNGACPTPHVITNSLAFNNGACGFTDNGNGGAIKMSNCTAVNNGVYASKGNFMCYRTSSSATYSNLVSYGNSSSDKFLGKLTNVISSNGGKYYYTASGSYSSSTTPKTTAATISSSSFTSSSIPGYSSGKYATNYHTAFRNSDGSVNMNGLFQLKSSINGVTGATIK